MKKVLIVIGVVALLAVGALTLIGIYAIPWDEKPKKKTPDPVDPPEEEVIDTTHEEVNATTNETETDNVRA